MAKTLRWDGWPLGPPPGIADESPYEDKPAFFPGGVLDFEAGLGGPVRWVAISADGKEYRPDRVEFTQTAHEAFFELILEPADETRTIIGVKAYCNGQPLLESRVEVLVVTPGMTITIKVKVANV